MLFARGVRQPMFAPIRSLQFLAVIDAEEVVFVDGAYRRFIDVSWQNFARRQRDNLQAAVQFECVCYTPGGLEIKPRLQREFMQALAGFERRQPTAKSRNANIITALGPRR